MLLSSALSLLTTTLLLTTPTSAAPTRSHCRCTIVSAPETTTPNTHWTPASPPPPTLDICATLGPELEHFQHTEPDVYDSYISRTNSQRPLTSLKFPTNSGLRRRETEPRPTTRPRQRIVCRSEADPFTAYHGSCITLWALQIVMTIVILACLAEGVHLSLRWCGVRVPGGRELVLEITGAGEKGEWVFGVAPVVVVLGPDGESVGVTFDEEDDDDEVNRPVM